RRRETLRRPQRPRASCPLSPAAERRLLRQRHPTNRQPHSSTNTARPLGASDRRPRLRRRLRPAPRLHGPPPQTLHHRNPRPPPHPQHRRPLVVTRPYSGFFASAPNSGCPILCCFIAKGGILGSPGSHYRKGPPNRRRPRILRSPTPRPLRRP